MSTEQEISGAERKALRLAYTRTIGNLAGVARYDFEQGWLASGEFGRAKYMALVEVKRDLEKQVRELTHRLAIALESEVACAEQRQRADMAEERGKKLFRSLLSLADWIDLWLDLSDEAHDDAPDDEVVRASRPNHIWIEGKKRLAKARKVIADAS